jgi:hypothetical protein
MLNDIYSTTAETILKGDIVELVVTVEGDFELFQLNPLGVKALLKHWLYLSGGEIKPFELLDYKDSVNGFLGRLKVIKKSNEVDEFRLLYQDIADVFEIEDISMASWMVRKFKP